MADDAETFAPGWPGLPARWTSSAKGGVGTSVSRDSRVWFTLSHGILNEIYYPRVDNACTRDLGFIVTDGQTYFSEEKRRTRSETSQVQAGIPAYRIRNTAADGRYRIEKEILTDPWRDVVLQRIHFVPLDGSLTDFRLHVLLAPHLANRGSGNTGWVGDYKGTPMLLAQREHYPLALASSTPWLARSAGFVGTSDGWQTLHASKRLLRTYVRAENGNVALTGEIDLAASPACRSRGASPNLTTTWAAITWLGRETSWRSRAGSLRWARARARQTGVAISPGHAGTRRSLVPEYVARRPSVSAGHSDG